MTAATEATQQPEDSDDPEGDGEVDIAAIGVGMVANPPGPSVSNPLPRWLYILTRSVEKGSYENPERIYEGDSVLEGNGRADGSPYAEQRVVWWIISPPQQLVRPISNLSTASANTA